MRGEPEADAEGCKKFVRPGPIASEPEGRPLDHVPRVKARDEDMLDKIRRRHRQQGGFAASDDDDVGAAGLEPSKSFVRRGQALRRAVRRDDR